jgi:hypothetical protein
MRTLSLTSHTCLQEVGGGLHPCAGNVAETMEALYYNFSLLHTLPCASLSFGSS